MSVIINYQRCHNKQEKTGEEEFLISIPCKVDGDLDIPPYYFKNKERSSKGSKYSFVWAAYGSALDIPSGEIMLDILGGRYGVKSLPSTREEKSAAVVCKIKP